METKPQHQVEHSNSAARSEWVEPVVTLLSAGDAEASDIMGADGIATS